MNNLKHRWRTVPRSIRRPITLLIGMSFVLAAGSIGWMPGPGGIPLFLLGVAILASEFSWAQRFKIFILKYVHLFSDHYKKRPILFTIIISALISLSLTIMFMFLLV